MSLQIEVEVTGASELIPYYALDSSKPIWQGEARNCSTILKTNALTSLGFTVTHIDGTIVSQVESITETDQEPTFCVTRSTTVIMTWPISNKSRRISFV